MVQKLTKTQLELIAYLANGYRYGEIAELTHRSESSVKSTLATAQQRAGAKTMPHLISIVIANDLLVWTPDEERQVA
jgi:DNA-binding CsgD family transcriptional regulator